MYLLLIIIAQLFDSIQNEKKTLFLSHGFEGGITRPVSESEQQQARNGASESE